MGTGRRIAAVMIASTASQRAGLLRLAVVLAALVGIALIQSGHCQAGATMEMSTGSSMTSVAAEADSAHPVEHQSRTESVASAAAVNNAVEQLGEDDRPVAPAGIMMACLAMFLALSAAVALLRRPGSGWRGSHPIPTERLLSGSVPPRPPSLAELCVLRT